MNKTTQYKVLVAAVILLAALNIATLATLWLRSHSAKKEQTKERVYKPQTTMREPFTGGIFKNLELTEEQQMLFKTEGRNYHTRTQEHRSELQEIYKLIMNEIGAENPDTTLLNQYIEDIARLHVSQQQATINHFRTIRTICTPEQYQLFHAQFAKRPGNSMRQKREMMRKKQYFEKRNPSDSGRQFRNQKQY